jgi:metal-responsive CopG/Arc/MetJ family transcriptional regulator
MDKKNSASYIGKNSSKKSYDKKVITFYIQIEVIKRLNAIIGYRSRSQIINQIILDYVNKKEKRPNSQLGQAIPQATNKETGF